MVINGACHHFFTGDHKTSLTIDHVIHPAGAGLPWRHQDSDGFLDDAQEGGGTPLQVWTKALLPASTHSLWRHTTSELSFQISEMTLGTLLIVFKIPNFNLQDDGRLRGGLQPSRV